MRSSWCWSEPEEHAQAALGCALLIPTLGLVPMWMARRCAWPVVVHLSWAASGSALLLAAATVVGRVLPPLLEQAGGPWTPLAAALRAQGWAWLLLGLALPTLLALAHAGAAKLRSATLAGSLAEGPPRASPPAPPPRAGAGAAGRGPRIAHPEPTRFVFPDPTEPTLRVHRRPA